MKGKIDKINGDYLLIETVSEGKSECQVVIVSDEKRWVIPETMDLEEAVALADKLRIMLDLPTKGGIVKYSAILASGKQVHH